MITNTAQDILTPEEAAKLLRVELSWIYAKTRKCQRNPLPVFRIGKYLRFSRADILTWLQAQGNQRKARA